MVPALLKPSKTSLKQVGSAYSKGFKLPNEGSPFARRRLFNWAKIMATTGHDVGRDKYFSPPFYVDHYCAQVGITQLCLLGKSGRLNFVCGLLDFFRLLFGWR